MSSPAAEPHQAPDAQGHFGPYGGRYVPETLMHPLQELEDEYFRARKDPSFQRELDYYLKEFCGRPTPLYFAERLTRDLGGAKVYLKREDLSTPARTKLITAWARSCSPAAWARRGLSRKPARASTAWPRATVAAMFGLKCVVYMGAVDCERQALNVFRMKMLGAEVVPVEAGQQTLKEAINEAMRDWVTHVRTTHYILGTVYGAHPYPLMVRDFQRVIGDEARRQNSSSTKGACPTPLSPASAAAPMPWACSILFFEDAPVQMIGVEAGGEGIASGKHAARFQGGSPGVLQGARSYLLQDAFGQIQLTHSVCGF